MGGRKGPQRAKADLGGPFLSCLLPEQEGGLQDREGPLLPLKPYSERAPPYSARLEGPLKDKPLPGPSHSRVRDSEGAAAAAAAAAAA
ncbi:hypothetical protein Emed_005049 [Eimeria media]